MQTLKIPPKSHLACKMRHYKAVAKHTLSAHKGAITTAFAIGAVMFAPEALANGVTNEVNFSSLADEALDSIKNAGKAAMAVFGVGITIVGSFKGYSLLKGGIKKT